MRPSSANNNWLYLVDMAKAREAAAREMCRACLNLRRRFRTEVHRESRLEDRAISLTDAERKYLKTVSDAEDALEAQSAKLANAFLVFSASLEAKKAL